jgi:tRNA U34 5-methylaminomethyl-2-thiouridine-forming methyltransferase MnmC
MQIINTHDGSHTIYLPEMDEQYHSLNGAVTESKYVYLEKGFSFSGAKNPTVFEVGFGTGLNCFLTALIAEKEKRPTIYYSIEKFPLAKSIIKQLNFAQPSSIEEMELFDKIHDCNWNEVIRISEYFKLKKINADLTNYNFDGIEKLDIIYYDAFGPDKQTEMWTPQIFNKISQATAPGGVLVTYSAKGEVRRQLMASGFEMVRLQGPPGKNQMLRGIKKDANI